MGFVYQLALVLTAVTLTGGQYGPIKGPATRRTTTPFPPGFQSDNEIYNGPSAGSSDAGPGSHGYSYHDKTRSGTGASSSTSSHQPGSSFSSSSVGHLGGPFSISGTPPNSSYGSLPSSNQRPAVGAVSTLDNPWLSGIVAQNSGNRQPGPSGCGGGTYGGGCLSPSSPSSTSFQQTSPTVSCSNPGYACVPKNQCHGGQTTSPGSGLKQCDLNTEVCCRRSNEQSGQPDQPGHLPGQSGQPETPGRPGYPGYPSQPGQPGRPGQGGHYPVQPNQPGTPGRPGQPGQPGKPGYPGQPGQPGQVGYYPDQTGHPGTPGRPGQPGQPGKPGYPGQPGQPGQVGYYPDQTGHPGTPGGPGQPGQPGKPGYPGQPGQPGQGGHYPGQPGQPGQGGHYPVQPNQPGTPGRPGQPGQSGYPGQPGQPGQVGYYPDQPGQPGTPGRPGQPGQPGKPGYPGQPGQPGQGGHYPGQPGQPGQGGHYPVQPNQPGTPGRPGQPGQSGYPGQPGQPGQEGYYPDQPGQPGTPSRPGQPGHPGQGEYYPGQPGTSSRPGHPGEPGRPGTPGRPGQPESSGRPGYPSRPGRPAQPGTGGVPIGGSIYDARPVGQSPTNYVTEAPIGPYTGPLNTTPHVGCPAALKCVQEIYCTWDGIMSDTPVTLTREQEENKVPLSECQNIETGIIGKCCRDPNYEDPWPSDVTHGDGHGHDDGQYHGPGADHGHGGHGAGAQHHPQGTGVVSCGPSSICTTRNDCTGDRLAQQGKRCRVPPDGSTGVCCKKPQLPTGSSNLQSLSSSDQRPSPGHQYYRPKPSGSKNPFLPENLGKGAIPKPGFSTPAQYSPIRANAILGGDKKQPLGKPSPNNLLLDNDSELPTSSSPFGISTSTPSTETVELGHSGSVKLTPDPQKPSGLIFPSPTPDTSVLSGSTALTPFSGVSNQYLASVTTPSHSLEHFPVSQKGQSGKNGVFGKPGALGFGGQITPHGGSVFSHTTPKLSYGMQTVGQPGRPATAGVLRVSGYPSQPGQQDQPGISGTIGQSEHLGTSAQPERQGTPGTLGYSVTSTPNGGTSIVSHTTATPPFGQPSPAFSGRPGTSGQPSNLDTTEQPNQTGHTGSPGQPGHSETPGQTTQYLPPKGGKPGISGTAGLHGQPETSGTFQLTGTPGYAVTPTPVRGTSIFSQKTATPTFGNSVPGFLIHSKTSVTPGQLGLPGRPGTPGKPGEEGQSGIFEAIGQPGNLGTPGHPGRPGAPGTPSYSVHSTKDGGTTIFSHTTPISTFGQSIPGHPGQPASPSIPGKPRLPGYPSFPPYRDPPGRFGTQGETTEYLPPTGGKPGAFGKSGQADQSGTVGMSGQPIRPGTPTVPGYGGMSSSVTVTSAFSQTTQIPAFGESTNGRPGNSGRPAQPGQAGSLGISGKPGQSGLIRTFSRPGQPGRPGTPDQIGQPAQPGQPGSHAHGSKSTATIGTSVFSPNSTPAFSHSTPGQPGRPETPNSSGKPGKPDQPGHLGSFGKPGQYQPPTTGKPGTSGTSSQPGGPETPGRHGYPGQSGRPGTPGYGGISTPVRDLSACSHTTAIPAFGQPTSAFPCRTASSNTPGRLGHPSSLSTPGKPAQPGRPVNLVKDGNLGTHGQKTQYLPPKGGKPGISVTPGHPEQTGQSGISGTFRQPVQPGRQGAPGTSVFGPQSTSDKETSIFSHTTPSSGRSSPEHPTRPETPDTLRQPELQGGLGALEQKRPPGTSGFPGYGAFSNGTSISSPRTSAPTFGQSNQALSGLPGTSGTPGQLGSSGSLSTPGQPGHPGRPGQQSFSHQFVKPGQGGQPGIYSTFGQPSSPGHLGTSTQPERQGTPGTLGYSVTSTPNGGTSIVSHTTATPPFGQPSPAFSGRPGTSGQPSNLDTTEQLSQTGHPGSLGHPAISGTFGQSGHLDTHRQTTEYIPPEGGKRTVSVTPGLPGQYAHPDIFGTPASPDQVGKPHKPGTYGNFVQPGQTGRPGVPGIDVLDTQPTPSKGPKDDFLQTTSSKGTIFSHTTATSALAQSIRKHPNLPGQIGESEVLSTTGYPAHLGQQGITGTFGHPGSFGQVGTSVMDFTPGHSSATHRGSPLFSQTTPSLPVELPGHNGPGVTQSIARPGFGHPTSSHNGTPFGQTGQSGHPVPPGQSGHPTQGSTGGSSVFGPRTPEKASLGISSQYLPSKPSTISGQQLIPQSPQKPPSSLYTPAQGNVIPTNGKVSTPLPSSSRSPIPSSTPSSFAHSTTVSSVNTFGSSPRPLDRIGSGFSTPSITSGARAPAFGSNAGIYSTPGSFEASPKGPPAGYPFLDLTTLSPNGGRQKPLSGGISYEPGRDCGVRRQVSRPNGLDGLETGFSEFPWQAQVILSSDQKPICSGAILSDRVVVTSAHCLHELRSDDLMIKAGDWKLGTENPIEEPKPTQIRQVAAVARHPKYDPVSRFNDVAVLVLSEPLQLDSNVDVLCLGDINNQGQKPKGNNCVVTGWGKQNLQANSGVLHSIPVNFIENEQCENVFRDTFLGKYFQLNKSFTCILPVQPNKDLCEVDTGSPIACQKPDGRYELTGIYSWDVGCHPNSNVPSASANVDRKWVDSVMKKPVDQVRREEEEERDRSQSLGFNPDESDLTKPGFSQGYGK